MEELKLTRQTISVLTELDNNTVEQPIDCDITLPDYCNDIQKILKCMALPGVASVSVSGTRLQAEGSVTVRILYIDENEELNTYEQCLPFAKYIEANDIQSAVFVTCKVKTGYMNCRAVNKRRVDVHGAVTLCFLADVKEETSVLTGDTCGSIERRTRVMRLANSVADAGRYFSITQVESLKERAPVASVVRTSGYALVNEVKVIKDKALIRGDLLVTTGYTAKGSGRIETVDIRIPISQIVDAVGLDENEVIDTQLHVTQLNVIPKPDGAGDYTLLDISVKLMAEMHAYKEMELEGITDAYCTQCPVNLQRNTVPILRYVEKIDETIVSKKHFSMTADDFSDVLDIWCDDVSASYRLRDGGIEIYGTANVWVIGISEEVGYTFFEQSLDFACKRETDLTGEVFCIPSVRAIGNKATVGSDGGLDISVEFAVKANIFERERAELVSDICTCDGETQVQDDGAAVIIYFASEDESVWDIARKYNTTVGAVMAENNLCEDRITENTMLLIPR